MFERRDYVLIGVVTVQVCVALRYAGKRVDWTQGNLQTSAKSCAIWAQAILAVSIGSEAGGIAKIAADLTKMFSRNVLCEVPTAPNHGTQGLGVIYVEKNSFRTSRPSTPYVTNGVQ